MSTAEGSGRMITNGLITYYDAANLKSYPTTGSIWNDMIGTNNLTLISGATYNGTNSGTIVYDGISARTVSTISVNTGQDFTVSIWMKASLLGNTRRALIGNSFDFTIRNGWLFSTAGFSFNNTFFFSIGQDSAYQVAQANSLTTNTWYYLTATVVSGGSSISLYKDDTVITSYAQTLQSGGIISYNTNQFNVGWRLLGGILGTTDPFTGNISIVQIYNRVLTAREITQNYNATKSRFGK